MCDVCDLDRLFLISGHSSPDVCAENCVHSHLHDVQSGAIRQETPSENLCLQMQYLAVMSDHNIAEKKKLSLQ